MPAFLVSRGLENFLDNISRRPETVATRAGLRLYDVPPGKYPEEMEGMSHQGRYTWNSKQAVLFNELVKLNVSHVKIWKHPIETSSCTKRAFQVKGSCHS